MFYAKKYVTNLNMCFVILFSLKNTANLGGVMSLCLGFSLLSLIEVIYFFTMRAMNDIKRYYYEQRQHSVH